MSFKVRLPAGVDIFDNTAAYSNEQIKITYFSGLDLLQEIIDLRTSTFVDEKGFLDQEHLTSENDRSGTHILVYDIPSGKLMGCTHIVCAEDSDFSFYTDIPADKLRTAVLSSRSAVNPEFRNKGIFSLLIYLAGRWGRMRGRKRFVGFIEQGNPPIKKMLRCPEIPNVPLRTVSGANGEQYQVVSTSIPIDYVTYRSFQTMSKALREFASNALMPAELMFKVENGIDDFYNTKWYLKVMDETLTKDQYIAALSNIHLYVKWTTRLLATVVGQTEERELRGDLLHHLEGEVDHELMLERDLEALDWDVGFVQHAMSPNPEIIKFMAMQQSLASFERDPVMFLVAPLVAEGLSANMVPEFIHALERCIRSWGITKPKTAMSFLHSHIYTDGGDKGHWQAVQKTISKRISSESRFQHALNLTEAMFVSMCSAYNDFVNDADLDGFDGARTESRASRSQSPAVTTEMHS